MRNGFDRVAGVYDFFERIMFGTSLLQAQRGYLHRLKGCRHILFVGGGTGKVLVDVLRANPLMRITYVEASGKMLKKAKKRLKQPERVRFVNQDVRTLSAGEYDAVITFFFLDVLAEEQLSEVVDKIRNLMAPQAVWLYADFQSPQNFRNRMLSRMMHFFFRVTAGLQVRRFLDHKRYILKQGLALQEERLFHKRFISSAVFRLPADKS